MARSSRPELVKDNPMAPQMYVRHASRQARHGAMPSRSSDQADLADTLLKLTEAAEAFVNGMPRRKRMDAEREALLDAITHAQLVLSREHSSVTMPHHSVAP